MTDHFDVRAHIDARLDSEHAAVALGMDNLDKLLDERHRYFDSQISAVSRELEVRSSALVSLLSERHNHRDAEIAAMRASLRDEINGIKSLFAAAIVAQEKAVQKAEEAQLRHNEQTNGYETQLLEQYRHMLPRAEADVSIHALQEAIARLTDDLTATRTNQSNIQVQLATREQTEDRGNRKFDSTIALWVGFGVVLTPLLVYFLSHIH